jgi:gas vesicle structural protein
MAVPTQTSSGGALSEVLELILDRGVVIDAFVRVSLVGIEVLTIDARIVVASVDTYLRFAEAVGRVNLDNRKAGVPELLAGHKATSALEAAAETYGPALANLLGQADAEPAKEEQR